MGWRLGATEGGLAQEVGLPTQRVHVAIPYIVALASMVMPMGESLAAISAPAAAEATAKPQRCMERPQCKVTNRFTQRQGQPPCAPARGVANRGSARSSGAVEVADASNDHRLSVRPHKRERTAPSLARRVVAPRERSDGARSFTGLASYFSEPQRLATGETYNPATLICAHRTLPIGTKLRVSNPKTGRSVVVVVRDRGPFVHGRVLDLSVAAARALGMIGQGVMLVSASVL